MILTPDMATEVAEALLDAASNSNGDNKTSIDVVMVSNNLAVSMPSTDDDHGYTIIHQVQSYLIDVRVKLKNPALAICRTGFSFVYRYI